VRFCYPLVSIQEILPGSQLKKPALKETYSGYFMNLIHHLSQTQLNRSPSLDSVGLSLLSLVFLILKSVLNYKGLSR
jgi:hypothetical protein